MLIDSPFQTYDNESQLTFKDNALKEFRPHHNSTVNNNKPIFNQSKMKPSIINLPTVINLNSAIYQNKTVFALENNNNFNQKALLETKKYTDVKIGDFRISIESMFDLENGNWLSDNVIQAYFHCISNLKINHIVSSFSVKKIFIDGDFSVYRKVSRIYLFKLLFKPIFLILSRIYILQNMKHLLVF